MKMEVQRTLCHFDNGVTVQEGNMKRTIQAIACRFNDAVPFVYFKRSNQWGGGYMILDQERLSKIVHMALKRVRQTQGYVVPTSWGWTIIFDEEV